MKPLLTEDGVHKVQKISKTSCKDKVHTSTASVAILQIFENSKIIISDSDIEISNFKGSGPGGQHRSEPHHPTTSG
jgi:peptide chain release factor 1